MPNNPASVGVPCAFVRRISPNGTERVVVRNLTIPKHMALLGSAAQSDEAAASSSSGGGGLAELLTLTVAELESPSVLTGSVHVESPSRGQVVSAWVRLPVALVYIYKRELPYNGPF